MGQRLSDTDFLNDGESSGRLSDADFNLVNNPRIDAIQGSDKGRIPFTNIDVPTRTNLDKFGQASADVENEISKRHSFIKDLINNPANAQNLHDHPYKTAGNVLMGASEMLGGIPADLALAAQRGTAKGLSSDILKTITGQRPSTMGDVAQASSVPYISNPYSAAGIDILANSVKGSPMSGLGELIGHPLSKITSPITDAVSSWMKPKVANALSSLSGVHPDVVQKAIENPEYLNHSFIESQKKSLAPVYNRVVSSLEDDPTANVTLTGAAQKVKDLGMTTKLGVPSSQMNSLTKPQLDNITHYADSINHAAQNPTSFNTARGMKIEIDKELGNYWASVKSGNAPKATTYERLLLGMRKGIADDLHTQFPDFGKVDSKMSQLMDAEHVNTAFESGKGSFFRSLPLRVGLTGAASAVGGVPGAAIALGSFYGSTPAGQAQAIKNIARLHALLSEPTMGMDIARMLNEKNGENNSDTNQ